MPDLEPSLYYFSGVVENKPRQSASGGENQRGGHSRIPAPPSGTVVVAAGRRAGTVRDSPEATTRPSAPMHQPPSGINPSYNPQAGGSPNGPRYGRRASEADPSMDSAQSTQQQSALAKLKLLSNSRAVRAPSPSATMGDSGYIPSSAAPPSSSGSNRPAPIPRSPAAPPPPSHSTPQAQMIKPPAAKARPPSVTQRPQWSDDTEVAAPEPPPPAPAPPPANANRSAALQALAARKAQQQQQQTQEYEPPPAAPKRSAAPPPARAAPPAAKPAPPQPAPSAPPSKPPARAAPPRPPPPSGPTSDIDAIPIGGRVGSFVDMMDELPPGAIAPSGPLIQCDSCGRKFNEKALKVHSRVCKKVFVDERKKFDVERVPQEALQLAKKAEKNAKKDPKAAAKDAGKKAKWKQQSDQLRAAMQANRQIAEAKARGEDISTVKFMATAEEDDDRVACPHCGRKFAEKAAERHIPHCKESMMKKGPPPKKPVGKK